MPATTTPLVSCLCVTREKPVFLKRAIQCFLSQSYPNKELLIVYEDDDPATRRAAKSISHDSIRTLEVPSFPKMTLGELRNLSIKACTGDYFCQWDDDDWYHNMRIEAQMDALLRSHKRASVLAYWLIYDTINNDAFLSIPNPWPGTVLCHKQFFLEGLQYESRSKSEDTAYLIELMRLKCIVPVVMPSLYIYSYHARNTWGMQHFVKMFANSQRMSPEVTELFRKIFNGEIDNDQASDLLMGETVLAGIDYFQTFETTQPE